MHSQYIVKDVLGVFIHQSTLWVSQNLAAWVVAGGAAYVLWIRPEQQARQQQQVCFAMQHTYKCTHPHYHSQQEEWATRVAKYKEIDRARPIPDAQDTGLIKGRRE